MNAMYFAVKVGLAGNPKIAEAAEISGTDRSAVVAVLLAMLEAAAQSDPPGDLSAFDPEVCAEAYGMEWVDIASIVDALRAAGVVGVGFKNWADWGPHDEGARQ